jgi:hypothetical protein
MSFSYKMKASDAGVKLSNEQFVSLFRLVLRVTAFELALSRAFKASVACLVEALTKVLSGMSTLPAD